MSDIFAPLVIFKYSRSEIILCSGQTTPFLILRRFNDNMISLGTCRFASRRRRHKLRPISLGEYNRVVLRKGSLVLADFQEIFQPQSHDKGRMQAGQLHTKATTSGGINFCGNGLKMQCRPSIPGVEGGHCLRSPENV